MSQFVLPQRIGFNVSPGAMTFDSIMAKLYPPVRGPYMYRRGAGISGLGDNVVGQTSGDYTWDGRQWVESSSGLPSDVTQGNLQQAIQESQAAGIDVNVPASMGPAVPLMSYYDLLAQAHLQNCDPRDSACVSNNVARQAAVEDYWVSHKMTVPVGTVMQFAPQTTAEVNEFQNPNNPSAGGVVDTRGVLTVNGQVAPSSTGQGASQYYASAAPTPAPAPKPNQSVPPTTPLTPMNTGIQKTGQVMQTVYQQNAGTGGGTADSSSGMSSNTLLIAAAVGVGLLFLMGSKS